jgi:hypothetical protein
LMMPRGRLTLTLTTRRVVSSFDHASRYEI